MFKTIFTKLCNERGESPTSVCLKVGLSNAAYTAWTEDSVPRLATLLKIADYFGVSTDYLLGRETPVSPFGASAAASAPTELDLAPLTEREIRLMQAYRERGDVRHMVNKLLDISDGDEASFVYRAADSDGTHPDEVVRARADEADKVKKASESEEILL